MTGVNVAVLVGRVTGPPIQIKREGKIATEFKVETVKDEPYATAVPVVAFDEDWGDPSTAAACLYTIQRDDEVMVIGSVTRRYERKQGGTIARTEVRANRIIQRGTPEGSPSSNQFEAMQATEVLRKAMREFYEAAEAVV